MCMCVCIYIYIRMLEVCDLPMLHSAQVFSMRKRKMRNHSAIPVPEAQSKEVAARGPTKEEMEQSHRV